MSSASQRQLRNAIRDYVLSNKVHHRLPGKAALIFEEEVLVVVEPICHALDDLDLVVDAFKAACVQRPAAVSEDAWEIGLQTLGEARARAGCRFRWR